MNKNKNNAGLFTPRNEADTKRYKFTLADDELSKVERGHAWAATLKLKNGKYIDVRGAACSSARCFCDAVLIKGPYYIKCFFVDKNDKPGQFAAIRKGTNFDYRISPEEAARLMREHGEAALPFAVMCKEYGDDSDWVGMTEEDIRTEEDAEPGRAYMAARLLRQTGGRKHRRGGIVAPGSGQSARGH